MNSVDLLYSILIYSILYKFKTQIIKTKDEYNTSVAVWSIIMLFIKKNALFEKIAFFIFWSILIYNVSKKFLKNEK